MSPLEYPTPPGAIARIAPAKDKHLKSCSGLFDSASAVMDTPRSASRTLFNRSCPLVRDGVPALRTLGQGSRGDATATSTRKKKASTNLQVK